MQKWVWLVTAVLIIGAGGVIAQDAPATSWTCPEDVRALENKTLNVLNWSTYIAEDTIPNFERLCGVRVTQDFFGSNEELIARLRAGNPGFDIIVPSDYAVYTLVAEELALPLDKANIPNLVNVSPALLDRPHDPGNVYTVPYQWGTIGIGYSVKAIEAVYGEGTIITSWNQVFDYPKRAVAWLDDQRSLLGVALVMLGYDPNTTNFDEIQQAADFLAEKGRNNVVRLAADDGQELLARGEVDMVIEYSGDIFQIAAACEEDPACDTTFAYSIPEEGSNLWVDNLMIPVGARNKRLAEAFIDYILDPQVGADISNYIAYASPNQAAIDAGLIDPDFLNSPIIYPDESAFANLFQLRGFPEDPEVEQAYNDAWDELKIRIGA